VVAQRGGTFSAEERRRIEQLRMPFVDASVGSAQRGFTVVGVPIGHADYVAACLHGKLFAEHLWRLAWQLVGMARRDFPAAYRVYTWSFTRRMGYLARNVDPAVGAAWFAGFDGLCAWVLDNLLHLRGAATAAAFRRHLERACTAGDVEAAAWGGPLVLPTLGPAGAGVQRLPLRAARLPGSQGGLGLPHLHRVCHAAFLGQFCLTMPQRVVSMQVDFPAELRLQMAEAAAGDPMDVADAAQEEVPPVFLAARAAIRYWAAVLPAAEPADAGADAAIAGREDAGPQAALAGLPDVLQDHVPAPLLLWAMGDSASVATALAAAADAAAHPTRATVFRVGGLRRAAAAAAHGASGEDAAVAGGLDDDDGDRQPSIQRELTVALGRVLVEALRAELEARGNELPARRVLAQLRSQQAPGALAWLSMAPALSRRPHVAADGAGLHAMAAVTMVLVTVFVDPWRLSGRACPYRGCRAAADGPTTVHALSCDGQHDRGPHATHTACKRQMQQALRSSHVGAVFNECGTMFKVPHTRRADTAISPGALRFAPDPAFRTVGFVVDTTVRAPTAATYVVGRGPGRNSAVENGYAARVAEEQKAWHHRGTLCGQRWRLVTFAHEVFGRRGREADQFLEQVAGHAAACEGGPDEVILRRRGILRRRMIVALGAALAGELAERVLVYMRGAILAGRRARPVSALLAECPA
jgi:hypothetical protein